MDKAKKTEITSMIKKIEADLKKSLGEVGDKYGYKLTIGRGTYDTEGNFTIKLEGLKNGAKSAAAQLYDANRISMGLPPLGTPMEFGIGSRTYIIVGINTTGTKIHGLYAGYTYLLKTDEVVRRWEYMRSKQEGLKVTA
jgi:hypothetical protein